MSVNLSVSLLAMSTTPRSRYGNVALKLVAVCCVLGLGGVPLYADVVTEFSLGSNPNGNWSYGTLTTLMGGTFNLNPQISQNGTYSGQQIWYNASPISCRAALQSINPARSLAAGYGAVERNRSPQSVAKSRRGGTPRFYLGYCIAIC